MEVLICFILGIIIGFIFATLGAKSKFEELYQNQHSMLETAAKIKMHFDLYREDVKCVIAHLRSDVLYEFEDDDYKEIIERIHNENVGLDRHEEELKYIMG